MTEERCEIKTSLDAHVHDYIESCVLAQPRSIKRMFDGGRCWFTIVGEDNLALVFKKSVPKIMKNLVVTSVVKFLKSHDIEVIPKDAMN